MMLCDKVPCKIPAWGFAAVSLMALVTLPSWSLGQLSSPSGVGSALDSGGGTSGSATQPAPSSDALAPSPLSDTEPGAVQQDPNQAAGPIAFSPDGKSIAVAAPDGQVAMQDAESGKVLQTIAFLPGQSIRALAFSPNGKYIAAAGRTKIAIVDAQSGKVLWVTEVGVDHHIDSMQFSPDAKLVTVVEGAWRGLGAKTWQLDADMGKVMRTFYGPAGDSDSGRSRSESDTTEAQSPPQSSKGDAQQPIEQRVRVLEEKLDEILKELRNLRTLSGPRPPSTGSNANPNALAGTAAAPAAMATSPDGKFVAGPLSPGRVAIFDAASGTLLRKFDTGFTDPVQSIEFAPDGKRLAVKGDGRLTELNVDTGNSDYTMFYLKYVSADSAQVTLQQVFRGESVQISVDARTNTIIAKGTAEQLSAVKSLIQRLDVRPEPKTGDLPSAGPSADMGAAAPTSTRSNRITPYGSVATQLDLVSLGTAMIDARGAVRLAQAKFERVRKLGGSNAVSQEEVLDAEINLDTAQRKLDLLTGIAQSALDLGKAELASAEADLSYNTRLVQKGFAPKSQVDQAEAQHVAAQAKLRLLNSLLGPTLAPSQKQ